MHVAFYNCCVGTSTDTSTVCTATIAAVNRKFWLDCVLTKVLTKVGAALRILRVAMGDLDEGGCKRGTP